MASVDSQKLVGVFVPRRRHDATIPDLLAERQLGTRMFRPSKTASTLSSAIAWNHNRLQNMILAVGPGTPAAALLDADPSSPSSSSDNESEHSEQEAQTMEQEAAHQREDDTEESESEEQALEENAPELARAMWFLRRQLESEGDSDMETDDEEDIGPPLPPGTVVSSIKHGGCINAACWLTCPWRLSIVGHEAGAHSVDCQEEHPTQLMTTGDDRVVKVWDVRYAMGSSNPLPGGHYMQAPFAEVSQPEPCCWKSWANRESPLSGSVIPLATLQTGHRNNIFHVTPVDHHPGKVATCGADGYLRISDLNAGPSSNSSVVVSADSESDNLSALLPAGLLSLRSSMCFSHHFLDANCGLLCSERGLKHFDIRSPPREQRSQSLLGNGKTCKSCAIWNAGAPSDSIESAYVFAGGSNADVTLFDLRMTDPDENRIVQRYRPSGIAPDAVSVSGLDISKDKRELLVSYENDQIYSFPIFPDAKSIAGPNLEEINECCRIAKDNKSHRVSELAAYGGHLNRFTFLKNAKYAGPNDEYICTGSDSGKAGVVVFGFLGRPI
jgi:WD40 repeat protein